MRRRQRRWRPQTDAASRFGSCRDRCQDYRRVFRSRVTHPTRMWMKGGRVQAGRQRSDAGSDDAAAGIGLCDARSPSGDRHEQPQRRQEMCPAPRHRPQRFQRTRKPQCREDAARASQGPRPTEAVETRRPRHRLTLAENQKLCASHRPIPRNCSRTSGHDSRCPLHTASSTTLQQAARVQRSRSSRQSR